MNREKGPREGKKGEQKRKIVRKWGQILEPEGMIKSFPLRRDACR